MICSWRYLSQKVVQDEPYFTCYTTCDGFFCQLKKWPVSSPISNHLSYCHSAPNTSSMSHLSCHYIEQSLIVIFMVLSTSDLNESCTRPWGEPYSVGFISASAAVGERLYHSAVIGNGILGEAWQIKTFCDCNKDNWLYEDRSSKKICRCWHSWSNFSIRNVGIARMHALLTRDFAL